MVKPGNPFETWTSTETGYPTAPLSVAEATAASTTENGRGRFPDYAFKTGKEAEIARGGEEGWPIGCICNLPKYPPLYGRL